jgi:hypothetical protein
MGFSHGRLFMGPFRMAFVKTRGGSVLLFHSCDGGVLSTSFDRVLGRATNYKVMLVHGELPVLPENTYCLIFLTFFRDDINLVSSVIVRIQNHEAHYLRAVTTCIRSEPSRSVAA